MTLRASDDGGATWRYVGPQAGVLHTGPSAYSCLVDLTESGERPRIGVLFEYGERSPYERIGFCVRRDP